MPVHARVAIDPTHPVLVELPIVLYAATVVALVGHAIGGDVSWYRAALCASAASVAVAIVAVVPAIADLVGLSASDRWRTLGVRHAACNVVALIAFAAAGATIYSNYARVHELGDTAPLALAGVGLVAAIVSAWLGWMMIALLGARIANARLANARIARARMASVDELVTRLPSPRRTHG
jgi:uncharacterized membrane protein